jgi:hypothetical protein
VSDKPSNASSAVIPCRIQLLIRMLRSGSTSTSTTTVFVMKPATTSQTPISTTYTDYTVALPEQVLSVPLNCPSLNSQTITTAESDTYIFECGVDYVGNDLAALIAYRLEDCCTACSAFNYQQRDSGLDQKCEAFTFNANMSYTYANDVPPGGNNCWLKSVSDQGSNFTDSGHLVVGGKLAA